MKAILTILFFITAVLITAFIEGKDYEQQIKHSKRTYCEVYSCYEANKPIVYEFEKTKKN